MPHITFELSNNIIEKDTSSIINEVHFILTDTLPTKREHCKTRVVRHSEFFIGDGNKENAFLHISIEVMPGRSKQTLELVGKKIINIVPNYFKESASKLNLQISVAVKDLPEIYCKC